MDWNRTNDCLELDIIRETPTPEAFFHLAFIEALNTKVVLTTLVGKSPFRGLSHFQMVVP